MKLAGFLDSQETEGYLWIDGKFKNGIISAAIPENEGVVRINVKSTKTRIIPEITGNKVKMNIELEGMGSIYGNSTKLDFSIPENIIIAQEAIKSKINKQVENTIQVVQKEYGADIFGFGSAISQHKPQEWKRFKDEWEKIFPDIETSVSTSFIIKMPGMSGPPLYLKENEVKK